MQTKQEKHDKSVRAYSFPFTHSCVSVCGQGRETRLQKQTKNHKRSMQHQKKKVRLESPCVCLGLSTTYFPYSPVHQKHSGVSNVPLLLVTLERSLSPNNRDRVLLDRERKEGAKKRWAASVSLAKHLTNERRERSLHAQHKYPSRQLTNGHYLLQIMIS